MNEVKNFFKELKIMDECLIIRGDLKRNSIRLSQVSKYLFMLWMCLEVYNFAK